MNTMLALQPIRVTFPDGKPGIRHAEVLNPRLVNGVVVGNAVIDKQPLRVALDEDAGEYFPCDRDLKEIPFSVKSTSRIRQRKDRANTRPL